MAEAGISVSVGQKITFSKTVTDEDLVALAKVSGDTNPIHLEQGYAEKTRFGKRIAHGVLAASFISAAIGIVLPAKDETAVYLSQNLRFRMPVYIGDTITAELEVTAVDQERRRVNLNTRCVNQNQEEIVTGDALVMLDKYPFSR
ncbi:MAG: MaoC domain protein dehydratase [Dehalococcoidia bacterium]|nr:MaoC domain protein dehydratase [Dehalococcoidia bacterium]